MGLSRRNWSSQNPQPLKHRRLRHPNSRGPEARPPGVIDTTSEGGFISGVHDNVMLLRNRLAEPPKSLGQAEVMKHRRMELM